VSFVNYIVWRCKKDGGGYLEGQVLLMPVDDKLNPEFFEPANICDTNKIEKTKSSQLGKLVRGNTRKRRIIK